jgi:Super-infection exclusion protein B
VESHQGWFWAGLSFCGLMSLFYGLQLAQKSFKNRIRWHELAEDEKRVLRVYLEKRERTVGFMAGDCGPQSLLHKGILTTAKDSTDFFSSSGFFYYTISESAFKYLKKHSGLLAGEQN